MSRCLHTHACPLQNYSHHIPRIYTIAAGFRYWSRLLRRLLVIAGATIDGIRVRILTALAALDLDDWGFGDLDGHWSCQHEVERETGG